MFSQINFNAPRLFPLGENTTPSTSFKALPLEVHNELAYLEAWDHGTVGDKIESTAEKAHARKTVEAAFGKEYVNTISELDLADEFANYNKSEAFKCVTFLDWYTLRDYKQAGYTRVNRPLKDLHDAGHAKPGAAGSPLSEQAQALVTRLVDAMDKVGGFQQKEIQAGLIEPPDQVVYSGTDMSLAALRDLEPGSVYEYPAFLSTTIDEEVANEFINLPDDPDSGRAAVLYEIELAPESKALDTRKILRDGEEEILFPPKTKFVVREIREIDGVFKVSLSELSESHSEISSRSSVNSQSFSASRFGTNQITNTSSPTAAEYLAASQAGKAPQLTAGTSGEFETELAQMGVDLDFIISRPVDENIKPEYFGLKLVDGKSYRMAHTAALSELQDAVDAAFNAPVNKFREKMAKLDHPDLLGRLAPKYSDWLYSSVLRKVPEDLFPVLSKIFAEKLLNFLESGASEEAAKNIINVLLRFPKSRLEKAFFGVTAAFGLTSGSRQGLYREIIDRGDLETQALMYSLSSGLLKYADAKDSEKASKIFEYVCDRAARYEYGNEIRQQADKRNKGLKFTSQIDDQLSKLEAKVRTRNLRVLIRDRLYNAGLSMRSGYASRLTVSHLAILKMASTNKVDIRAIQDAMIRGGIDVDQLELTTFTSEDQGALDRIMASRDVKKIMDEAIGKTPGHIFTHVQGVTIPYIDVQKVTAFAMKNISALVERDSHFAGKASNLKAYLAYKNQLMTQIDFRCVAAVTTSVARQVKAEVNNAVDGAVAKITKSVTEKEAQSRVAAEVLDRASKEVEKRAAKQASDQITAKATDEVQRQIEARAQENAREKTQQYARDQAARATKAAADKATRDAVQASISRKVEEEKNVLARLSTAPSVPQSAPGTPASVRDLNIRLQMLRAPDVPSTPQANRQRELEPPLLASGSQSRQGR